jgi:hypothetical protein
VNPASDTDAQEGLAVEVSNGLPRTAAEKVANTLRELSQPGEDAEEMELMLATICMGLERGLAEKLKEQQATGELDGFMLSLTRFLALHRSDSARLLVVVELPRRELPAGTRLHLLDEAIAASENPVNPLK